MCLMVQRTPISVNWSPSSQQSSYSGEIEAFLQAQMWRICLASSIESTSNTTTLSCGLLAALLMLSCSPLYSATLLLTPMPRYSRAFSAGGPLPVTQKCLNIEWNSTSSLSPKCLSYSFFFKYASAWILDNAPTCDPNVKEKVKNE